MFHFQTWISCLQLITSEGGTKTGSHFKWDSALWEHVIEHTVYCLCCQLWHKRFVPAFIWDFWREGKKWFVPVCRRLLCPFPVSIFLYVSIGAAHVKACMQALGSSIDWRVRELRVISSSLSLLGVTVQIAPRQALSSNPSLLPQLDPHHSDPSP